MCVCVCYCVRERESKNLLLMDVRGRDGIKLCVAFCVRVRVCVCGVMCGHLLWIATDDHNVLGALPVC